MTRILFTLTALALIGLCNKINADHRPGHSAHSSQPGSRGTHTAASQTHRAGSNPNTTGSSNRNTTNTARIGGNPNTGSSSAQRATSNTNRPTAARLPSQVNRDLIDARNNVNSQTQSAID